MMRNNCQTFFLELYKLKELEQLRSFFRRDSCAAYQSMHDIRAMLFFASLALIINDS